MHSVTHPDLMAGPPPTHLPVPPARPIWTPALAPGDVVRRHPASPVAWLAVGPGRCRRRADPLTVYAYARVGYHRSLDLLRRNGWKGQGPVPWEHEPNRGFLGCLALLAQSAKAIGETKECERCSAFLRDSSPTAYEVLLAGVPSGTMVTPVRSISWSVRNTSQATRTGSYPMVGGPDHAPRRREAVTRSSTGDAGEVREGA